MEMDKFVLGMVRANADNVYVKTMKINILGSFVRSVQVVKVKGNLIVIWDVLKSKFKKKK